VKVKEPNGYLIIPLFPVYLDDLIRPFGGSAEAIGWGETRWWLFDTFFAPFWNGKVKLF